MSKFFSFLTIACLLCMTQISQAQHTITVTGRILDKASSAPIPYASVAVKGTADGKIISGTTTGDDGRFSIQIQSTQVFFEVSFIGYQTKELRAFNAKSNNINIGDIFLVEDSKTLDEIEVTAEKSSVEFKLDKRVFNVDSDISSTGLGALDVLNNVPSVNVNIEGEISLRGNSGVQILINGKPSVLADEESNALGTITGDMIESIEVITNPSAKYQAEGSSGIINIILKKEEKKGFNGSMSVNTGHPANHSLGASLNKRTDNFNLFTQFGAGVRTRPKFSKSTNNNLTTNTIIKSIGEEEKTEKFFNLTLGTDYYINELNTITLSGNFAFEKEDEPTDYSFYRYEEGDVLQNYYTRDGTTTADNPKYQYDLQYKKTFKNNEDHTLLLSTTGHFFGKDQNATYINELIEGSEADDNQRTETDYHQSDYTFRADYTNPFTDKMTLETGALYEINDVGNDYAVYEDNNGAWVLDTDLTNNFKYTQKVLGVYATGSYEGDIWGVKLGLRAENTDLSTLLTTTNESNNRNYTNLFPSLHTSFKMNKMMSLQAGYSRRIRRPWLWDLNPFFSIQNTYSIRHGNPDLKPEFADSYEITTILIFDKLSLNASLYHLYTTDVIESVSYFEDNVTTSQPENIGSRHQTGLEINGKYDPLSWVSLSGDFNYGHYIREGQFNDQNFDFDGNRWTTKLSSKIKFPADFEAEISGQYESKYETVQGSTEGFAYADAGIRKKLWKGKMVINAAVRDIFASRKRESTVIQSDYETYNLSKSDTFYTLGLSYSFGKGEAMTYSGGRRH